MCALTYAHCLRAPSPTLPQTLDFARRPGTPTPEATKTLADLPATT